MHSRDDTIEQATSNADLLYTAREQPYTNCDGGWWCGKTQRSARNCMLLVGVLCQTKYYHRSGQGNVKAIARQLVAKNSRRSGQHAGQYIRKEEYMAGSHRLTTLVQWPVGVCRVGWRGLITLAVDLITKDHALQR
jgi:hypothetical protein